MEIEILDVRLKKCNISSDKIKIKNISRNECRERRPNNKTYFDICVKNSRYELPGINALNFVLKNALGGGGVASLRSDPQVSLFFSLRKRD